MKKHLKILELDFRAKAPCAMCNQEKELRPYGPNGEAICFECAMKDEESAKRQFNKLVEQHDLVIIQSGSLTKLP